eukprot:TRINITY_DN74581_c0_g1_i1.p1 TRINITY_DN74581_c0_g1~~TRINITY_DN74581_c0_g1_i1.p1  ORF type:complete len:1020 (+),score=192.81 TRINITY_DN74581_c0_g1_i1:168-3062(+)
MASSSSAPVFGSQLPRAKPSSKARAVAPSPKSPSQKPPTTPPRCGAGVASGFGQGVDGCGGSSGSQGLNHPAAQPRPADGRPSHSTEPPQSRAAGGSELKPLALGKDMPAPKRPPLAKGTPAIAVAPPPVQDELDAAESAAQPLPGKGIAQVAGDASLGGKDVHAAGTASPSVKSASGKGTPPPPKYGKGGVGGKGKGKGKGPQTGKASSSEPSPVDGDESAVPKSGGPALPSWQGPQPANGLKPAHAVHWQPIRQVSRWSGSIWEEVHTSMQEPEESVFLSEEILNEAFMTRQADNVGRGARERRSTVHRRLPQKSALTVDLNYMMLVRKGTKNPEQLRWVLGGVWEEVEGPAEALQEATLEAVLNLLQAVGEDAHRLCDDSRKEGDMSSPRPDVELVPSEAFLRSLLLQCGPIDVLQARVRNALYMSRFFFKATALQSELDAVLDAVWAVLHSKTIPVLLQGVLMLGNYVNSSSRSLGGAVGVTLESLAKLAYTQCRPPGALQQGNKDKDIVRRATRRENALKMLVEHIESARPSFTENLSSDLEGCRIARNFDQKQVEAAIQELATQVDAVERVMEATPEGRPDVPEALSPERLRFFLDKATPGMCTLVGLRAEAAEAVVALRRWLAEPPESTLSHMLRNLATIREALPTPQVAVARRPLNTFVPPAGKPQADRKASTASTAVTAFTSQSSEGDGLKEDDSLSLYDDATPRDLGSPSLRSPCTNYIEGTCSAPFRVVARSQGENHNGGNIHVSWVFDWSQAPEELKTCQNGVTRFEVVCRDQTTGWSFAERRICTTSPVEMTIPPGAVYECQVRAVFVEAEEAEACMLNGEAPIPLWASPYSISVTCDLTKDPAEQQPSAPPGHAPSPSDREIAQSIELKASGKAARQQRSTALDWWAGTLNLDGEFMKDVLYLLCARRDPPSFEQEMTPIPTKREREKPPGALEAASSANPWNTVKASIG